MEERVNTELKVVLDQMPELIINKEQMPFIQQSFKEMIDMNKRVPNPAVTITDRLIPGPSREQEIRVRIYRTEAPTQSSAGLLWIHGGGYVLGTPEMDDGLCERFVLEANCTVVSVDYRLAPEHPFPAPLDDCYAALTWFSQHAEELGVNPSQIAVAGASAGGGLTAATSLLARDRMGPEIIFQMPLYPMIDDRHVTPSSKEIHDNRVWNEESNRKAWNMYLGDLQDEVSIYAAPARCTDFSNLPPTYTCVGDLDPFRDETIEYIAKLTKAGVPTEFHLYPGCYHGFDGYAPFTEIGKKAIDQYVQALCEAFKKVGVKQV